MAASDSEDELQRAIALSLQETSSAASPEAESIYEKDMRQAMALSLADMPKCTTDDTVMDPQAGIKEAGSSAGYVSQFERNNYQVAINGYGSSIG